MDKFVESRLVYNTDTNVFVFDNLVDIFVMDKFVESRLVYNTDTNVFVFDNLVDTFVMDKFVESRLVYNTDTDVFVFVTSVFIFEIAVVWLLVTLLASSAVSIAYCVFSVIIIIDVFINAIWDDKFVMDELI